MTIKYLDSKRLSATSTDFNSGDGIPAGVDGVGGWKELGRTTLGSAGDDIDITSLPDKRYYHVLINPIPTGSINSNLHLNGSSTGYAQRHNVNGGSDVTLVNRTYWDVAGTETNPFFSSMYIANLSGKEKLAIQHSVEVTTAGAGTAPERAEYAQKWVTGDVINRMNLNNLGTGSFDTDSEMVVLGWDESDTHTTNFWEQLASVEGDGTSTTISSGTITAKKYLWVQAFTNASSQNTGFQFNNDTGNNYTIRRSSNGGTDATETSIGYIEGSDTSKAFTNMFIINNSANEKLIIGNSIHNPTAGAGTAPTRNEVVGKWTNTSAQITEIDYMQQTTSVNFPSGSFIKVWGSD